MNIKGIVSEDFCNYKLPSMFIISSICDWKCCTEQNIDIGMCQNASLVSQDTKNINDDIIFQSYINNPITKAIVIGGLEPMLQINELVNLINYFRKHNCNDCFIIYTGYYPDEIKKELAQLKQYKNIIVKFGRFIPNAKTRYDKILGITLISDNQYAEVIS